MRLHPIAKNSPAIILFNDKERTIAEEVVHRMVKRAVEMEGTVTGEHGVGLIKRDYLARELGESTVDAMRKVRIYPPSPLSLFLSLHPKKMLGLSLHKSSTELTFPPLSSLTAEASFRPLLPAQLRQDCPGAETEGW